MAIPHAEAEFVNEEAVVLGLPRTHVNFRKMDDPTKNTRVNCIFLLLVKNPEKGYVKFLSRLTTLFQKREFLNAVSRGKAEDIIKLLEEKL